MKQYYEEACSRLDAEDEQEEAKELGSDDEICIGGGHGAASNTACPLSGKPVSPLHAMLVPLPLISRTLCLAIKIYNNAVLCTSLCSLWTLTTQWWIKQGMFMKGFMRRNTSRTTMGRLSVRLAVSFVYPVLWALLLFVIYFGHE